MIPFYGFAYGLTISIFMMLLLGLPARWALDRLGQRGAWGYGVLGALAGLVAPFVLVAIICSISGATYPWRRGIADATQMLPLGAWLGVCIGAAFWAIRRPDRFPSNPPKPAP